MKNDKPPRIPSELLIPHFTHLIGVRWAILSRPENLHKREAEMSIILRTLGELASTMEATFCSVALGNLRRDLILSKPPVLDSITVTR